MEVTHVHMLAFFIKFTMFAIGMALCILLPRDRVMAQIFGGIMIVIPGFFLGLMSPPNWAEGYQSWLDSYVETAQNDDKDLTFPATWKPEEFVEWVDAKTVKSIKSPPKGWTIMVQKDDDLWYAFDASPVMDLSTDHTKITVGFVVDKSIAGHEKRTDVVGVEFSKP